MRKRVVIATPTALIALLHSVAYGWRQEQVEKSAQQVGDLGRQLNDRFRVFVGRFADAGAVLKKAVDGCNRAAGSRESRVLTAARKFKELGAVVGDDLEDLPALDEMPRAVRSTESPDGTPAESPSSAATRSLAVRKNAPKNSSGMHRCIPEPSSRKSLKKLISSSWLSSSLAFYSPLIILKFPPNKNGGARCQLQCIVSASSLVKKKVNEIGRKLFFTASHSSLKRSASMKFFGNTQRFRW